MPPSPFSGQLGAIEQVDGAQVRPYLMADGGDVELVEIDGLVVKLRLKGACGSCPSSLTTMKMGIQRRMQERIPVTPPPPTPTISHPALSRPALDCRTPGWLSGYPQTPCICRQQEVMDVEQVMDEDGGGLELTEENVDAVSPPSPPPPPCARALSLASPRVQADECPAAKCRHGISGQTLQNNSFPI